MSLFISQQFWQSVNLQKPDYYILTKQILTHDTSLQQVTSTLHLSPYKLRVNQELVP